MGTAMRTTVPAKQAITSHQIITLIRCLAIVTLPVALSLFRREPHTTIYDNRFSSPNDQIDNIEGPIPTYERPILANVHFEVVYRPFTP